LEGKALEVPPPGGAAEAAGKKVASKISARTDKKQGGVLSEEDVRTLLAFVIESPPNDVHIPVI
jgi:hypothetical protein